MPIFEIGVKRDGAAYSASDNLQKTQKISNIGRNAIDLHCESSHGVTPADRSMAMIMMLIKSRSNTPPSSRLTHVIITTTLL